MISVGVGWEEGVGGEECWIESARQFISGVLQSDPTLKISVTEQE